jgi:hypothetical protein
MPPPLPMAAGHSHAPTHATVGSARRTPAPPPTTASAIQASGETLATLLPLHLPARDALPTLCHQGG